MKNPILLLATVALSSCGPLSIKHLTLESKPYSHTEYDDADTDFYSLDEYETTETEFALYQQQIAKLNKKDKLYQLQAQIDYLNKLRETRKKQEELRRIQTEISYIQKITADKKRQAEFELMAARIRKLQQETEYKYQQRKEQARLRNAQLQRQQAELRRQQEARDMATAIENSKRTAALEAQRRHQETLRSQNELVAYQHNNVERRNSSAPPHESSAQMSISEARSILGVQPGCTIHDIERAYRHKALRAHPDRGGSAQDMHQLNQAKAILLGN